MQIDLWEGNGIERTDLPLKSSGPRMSHSDAAYHERMILDEGVSLAFEILRG
jgi:hypothetical protein